MNKMITSREDLIKNAREIIDENGLDNLNIRNLAKRCNISIGSVYNYFPSKADLIFALVEEFWKTIFKPEDFNKQDNISFIIFIDELYSSFAKHLNKFRHVFTGQLTLMKSSDKDVGKQIEYDYLKKVHSCIREALDLDKEINDNVWTNEFSKNEFARFVFENIFMMLVQGKKDCEYLKEVINRILY